MPQLQPLLNMEEYRRQLEQLRRQIEPLEAQLIPLKREERRFIGLLQAPPTKNTPIDRLSDDILAEIFIRALPSARSHVLTSHATSLRQSTPPLSLCFVCKRWKRVVTGCALLWTSLRLFISEEDVINTFHLSPTDGIDTQIARRIEGWKPLTKGAPIQLQIVFQGHASFRTDSSSSLLSQLDTTDFQRLTTLSLCHVRRHDLLNIPEGSFVALQDLMLSFVDWFEERRRHAIPQMMRAFSTCPALRRVALDTIGMREDSDSDDWGAWQPAIVLPWTQLTHLLVYMHTPASFFDQHMADCPSLSFLHFCVSISDDDDDDDKLPASALKASPKWKWPRLAHLSMYVQPNSDGIFNFPDHVWHIDPRHLKSLRMLNGQGDSTECTQEELAAFDSWLRSINSLKTLSISDAFPFHPGNFTGVLRLTPDVERLELRLSEENSGEPLVMLAGARRGLLPRLSTLVVQYSDDAGTREGLVKFVESRMADSAHDDQQVEGAGTSITSEGVSTHGTDEHPLRTPLERLVILHERPEESSLKRRSSGQDEKLRALKRFQEQGLSIECVEVGLKTYSSDSKYLRSLREDMQLSADWAWVERDEVLVGSWPEVQDFFLGCEKEIFGY